jgi:hypothetical protein
MSKLIGCTLVRWLCTHCLFTQVIDRGGNFFVHVADNRLQFSHIQTLLSAERL